LIPKHLTIMATTFETWKSSVMEMNMIIKLGDGYQVQTKKKGIVRLGGVDITVFFVSEFRISLLSVGQLDSHGYTTTFRLGICSIANAKAQKVLGANLEESLYILSMDGSAHISEIKTLRTAPHSKTVNMGHRHLPYLNHQDLRRLLESLGEHIMDLEVEPVADPMDDELPIMVPRLCPICIHTKQQQHIIQTKASRTSMQLELVHADLYWLMKHSIRGSHYYIIYIDDCTRYTEVYILITKTAEEISAKFQHYQAWVETQGFYVKRFHSEWIRRIQHLTIPRFTG